MPRLVFIVGGIIVALGAFMALRKGRTPEPRRIDAPVGTGAGSFSLDPVTGGPVSPLETPRAEDPAARAVDQAVLVKGAMTKAAHVLAENVKTVSPYDVREIEAVRGIKFPVSLIVAMRKQIPLYNIVPGDLFMGIMKTENGRFDPQAETFEANVNDYSVGLMQVRTATAEWLGLRGYSAFELRRILKDPIIGTAYGMHYLTWQWERYKDQADPALWASAAYNSGTAWFNFQRGTFGNQDYVDRVKRNRAKYVGKV